MQRTHRFGGGGVKQLDTRKEIVCVWDHAASTHFGIRENNYQDFSCWGQKRKTTSRKKGTPCPPGWNSFGLELPEERRTGLRTQVTKKSKNLQTNPEAEGELSHICSSCSSLLLGGDQPVVCSVRGHEAELSLGGKGKYARVRGNFDVL